MSIDLGQIKKKINQTKERVPVSETNEQKSQMHDIAIIGQACQFSFADNLEEYWNLLIRGTDAIHEFPEERKKFGNEYVKYQTKFTQDTSYYEGGFLNEVDRFDNEVFHINQLEVSLMSPEQRKFLQVAWKAIEDAGYGGNRTKNKDVGVFIGNSTDFGVPYKEFIDTLNPELSSTSIAGNLNGIVASRISFLNDWKGPAVNIDTACSSSLAAIHYACMSLRAGECSMAIAGSVKIDNLPIKEIKQKEDQLGITSEDGRTRTFDKDSNGTGLGEGVGVIVLKCLDKAIHDGDHICAVIKGSAVNHDGRSANLTAPNPAAQAEVLVRAWKDANIKPETISYIEAHGTGTKLGDPIEVTGLTDAFRKFTSKKQFCAIGSVKSNIGHLDHAAGMAGIIKLILCLEHKKMVPSIHYHAPNEQINFSDSPVYVNTEYKDWESGAGKRRCGISGFGLSGTNCHIVLEEANVEINKADHCEQEEQNYILTISACNKERLMDYLWNYEQFLYTNDRIDLHALCYTANTGRSHYNSRLVVLFRSLQELRDKLEIASIRGLENLGQDGIYFNTFQIVPNEQKTKKNGDITVSERETIDQKASEIVENIEKQGALSDEMLGKLAVLYCQGASVNWEKLYEGLGKSAKLIRIPTYPYAKKSYWIEKSKKLDSNTEMEAVKTHESSNVKVVGDESFTEKEIKIAQIIGDVLQLKEVNIYQSFIELGGNSIVAIKVQMELEEEGFRISIADLLSNDSLRKIIALSGDDGVVKTADSKSESQEAPVLNIDSEEQNDIALTSISDIKPFTEFIYKGCFYSALFPILQKYDQNILHIITNELMVYGYLEEEDLLSFTVQYKPKKTFEQCLERMNLKCNSQLRSADVVQDLMDSIDMRKPVIICIDCFYSSIRPDKYEKEHWPHNILVYGYNKEKQTFTIVEHKNSESMAYQVMEMSFEDVQVAYNGYFEEYVHMDIVNSNLYDSIFDESKEFPTYFEFEFSPSLKIESKEEEMEYIKREQVAFREENKELLTTSNQKINDFIAKFLLWVNEEEKIKENVEEIISIFNKINNYWLVAQYQYTNLYSDNKEIGMLIKLLVKQWDKVRNIFVKYYYSKRYSSVWVTKMENSILEVKITENKLYELTKEVD